MIVPARPFPSPFVLFRSPVVIGYPSEEITFFRLGRDALLAALQGLCVADGAVIICPAYICESTLTPLRACGYRVVFVDADWQLRVPLDTLIATIEATNARAVLIVHYFGFPVEVEPVVAYCRPRGIRVIEDCCHSFLSRSGGNPLGVVGDAAIFSIRKMLPVADGGALLHCNCGWEGADSMRSVSRPFVLDLPFLTMRTIESIVIRLGWPNLYGPTVDRLKHIFSHLVSKGVNMAEDASAIGPILPSWSLMHFLSDGPYLRHVAQTRRSNYRKLTEALAPLGLRMVAHALRVGEVPQVLPVMDPSGSLVDFLRGRGIGAYRWPGKELPSEVGSRSEAFPNAIRMNNSMVCLPVHQDIDDSHISFMVDAVAVWRKTFRTEA